MHTVIGPGLKSFRFNGKKLSPISNFHHDIRIASTEEQSAVAVSADGRVIVIASDEGRVCALALPYYEPLFQGQLHSQGITDLCLSHDGALVATTARDRAAHIWRAATGEIVQTVKPAMPPDLRTHVRAIRFSNDPNLIFTAESNPRQGGWISASRRNSSGTFEPCATAKVSTDALTAFSVNETGTLAALSSSEGHVMLFQWDGVSFDKIWSSETQLNLFKAPTPPHVLPVTGIRFSTSGRHLLTASADYTAAVWPTEKPPSWRKTGVIFWILSILVALLAVIIFSAMAMKRDKSTPPAMTADLANTTKSFRRGRNRTRHRHSGLSNQSILTNSTDDFTTSFAPQLSSSLSPDELKNEASGSKASGRRHKRGPNVRSSVNSSPSADNYPEASEGYKPSNHGSPAPGLPQEALGSPSYSEKSNIVRDDRSTETHHAPTVFPSHSPTKTGPSKAPLSAVRRDPEETAATRHDSHRTPHFIPSPSMETTATLDHRSSEDVRTIATPSTTISHTSTPSAYTSRAGTPFPSVPHASFSEASLPSPATASAETPPGRTAGMQTTPTVSSTATKKVAHGRAPTDDTTPSVTATPTEEKSGGHAPAMYTTGSSRPTAGEHARTSPKLHQPSATDGDSINRTAPSPSRGGHAPDMSRDQSVTLEQTDKRSAGAQGNAGSTSRRDTDGDGVKGGMSSATVQDVALDDQGRVQMKTAMVGEMENAERSVGEESRATARAESESNKRANLSVGVGSKPARWEMSEIVGKVLLHRGESQCVGGCSCMHGMRVSGVTKTVGLTIEGDATASVKNRREADKMVGEGIAAGNAEESDGEEEQEEGIPTAEVEWTGSTKRKEVETAEQTGSEEVSSAGGTDGDMKEEKDGQQDETEAKENGSGVRDLELEKMRNLARSAKCTKLNWLSRKTFNPLLAI